MNIHSNSIVSIFEEILNEKLCLGLSYESKFIQRSTSRLKGHEFIKLMVVPSEGTSEDSLEGLCIRLKGYNPDADMTAQALSERINSLGAVSLMKSAFSRILYHSRKIQTAISPALQKSLSMFNSVKIQDSTVMQVNERINKYPGVNRNKKSVKKSQMKIDVIHDFLTNQLVDVYLTSGKTPDQTFSGRILKFIQKKDLIIRDLGYFKLNVLKAIMAAGAFFVSRLLPNIKVFLNADDKNAVDLQKYVSKNFKNVSVVDINVFLGDLKLPARLVIYKAPKEVVKIRTTKSNKRVKDTGRVISKGKKFSLQYSTFVTNAPKEMIPAELVGTIYQLRWEIELVFKQWKSLLKVDYLQGINENRIECLIWGRMCMVLLLGLISQEFGKLAEKLQKELSIVKVIKYVLRNNGFGKAVEKYKVEGFMKQMEKDVSRRLCKNVRCRETMRERIIKKSCYHEMQHAEVQYVA